MFLLSKHPLVLSLLLITAASPVASAITAFENRNELKIAVVSYCEGTFNDESTYGSIENWDVSKITDMNYLFSSTRSCNPKIGNWDVSKVTDFSSMFDNASTFNQDISKWDVGSGTNFSAMFGGAYAFNQDISNWNVSSGIKFSGMFGDARAFNQDISNWDVSSGTDFYYMFEAAEAFNQPLIYCKWQSNSYFKNTAPNPCDGSCGWGLSECPFVCIDSPLQFQVETEGGSLLPFSCKLAKKDKDKLTCSDQGQVATHCPKVCGKCSEYECSDAEGVFFMRSGKERECSWLKEMTEDKRSEKCKKTKVAQTCRDTCKVCE